MSDTTPVLRAHAEQQFAEELAELARHDDRPRPPQWKLSPWAVCTYLMGGALPLPMTPLASSNQTLEEGALRACGLLA